MSAVLQEILKENLAKVIKDLPVESLAEVIDFAEFLREKKRREQADDRQLNERIAGLHEGEIWMSDDFNDVLPDDFWFGEDFGIIEKSKNESADR